MQETTVVESSNAMTRRRLKEAGFGDEQVQALVDVTGAERRALSADMAGLKASGERVKGEIGQVRTEIALLRTEVRGEIAAVHTRIDGLRDEVNARFDGVRDEMNARFDGVQDEMNARFERVDARFDGVKDEMTARFAGVDRQLKVTLWFLGVGLTLYAGTTVSLMMILLRDTPV